MKKSFITGLIISLALFTFFTLNLMRNNSQPFTPLPHATPESQQMDSKQLGMIDAVVQRAITEKKLPGAVVMVARNGKSIYKKAFGMRMLTPHKRLMIPGTVFDIAELTQPFVTAIGIMQLIEQNNIKLSDRFSKYFPIFFRNNKKDITIEQLLRHRSGLSMQETFLENKQGENQFFKKICNLSPKTAAGKKFQYNAINYLFLGKLIEKISGLSLDQYAQKYIFAPLGLRNTHFNPHPRIWPMIAPHEVTAEIHHHGQVRNKIAHHMGGIAGHAGLFSTVDDLAVLCQLVLNGGWYGKSCLLSKKTVTQMTSAAENIPPLEQFGLGWDINTPLSFPRGDYLSMRSFGHIGSTGTSVWMDPVNNLFIIFLSNQHHPDGKGNIHDLCSKIGTIVARSIMHKNKKIQKSNNGIA